MTSAAARSAEDVPTTAASVVIVVHCAHAPTPTTVGTRSTNESLLIVVNMGHSSRFQRTTPALHMVRTLKISLRLRCDAHHTIAFSPAVPRNGLNAGCRPWPATSLVSRGFCTPTQKTWHDPSPWTGS